MNRHHDPPDHFEARLALLPTEQGGRRTPIQSGYMPNWCLPTSDGRELASAAIELIDGEELAPGRVGLVRIYPFAPELWKHLPVGAGIEMTEGPSRPMGSATITRIIQAAVSASRG